MPLVHEPIVSARSLGPRAKGTNLRCKCKQLDAYSNENPPSRSKTWVKETFARHLEYVTPDYDIEALFDRQADRVPYIHRAEPGTGFDTGYEELHAADAELLAEYEREHPTAFAEVVAGRTAKSTEAREKRAAEVADAVSSLDAMYELLDTLYRADERTIRHYQHDIHRARREMQRTLRNAVPS